MEDRQKRKHDLLEGNKRKSDITTGERMRGQIFLLHIKEIIVLLSAPVKG